jgi:pimeloyl-ACP methyl ester carboxylesterase
MLWCDHLGCGESVTRSRDTITLDAQTDDIAAIVREFARGPAHVVGYCLGTPMTHDLVTRHREIVRSAVWCSPMVSVRRLFQHVLRKSIREGRLDPAALPADLAMELDAFLSVANDDIGDAARGARQALLVLEMIGRIRDFHEMYWSGPTVMQRWIEWMTEAPMSVDVFQMLASQYLARDPQEIPDYEGIPVLILRSDNDPIAVWPQHGPELLQRIPHAREITVPGGCHWMHFERPDEMVQATLEFFASLPS